MPRSHMAWLFKDGLLWTVRNILAHYFINLPQTWAAKVGTPGQMQSLIVDTGSGRTAFPCTTCGDGCGQPLGCGSSMEFRIS